MGKLVCDLVLRNPIYSLQSSLRFLIVFLPPKISSTKTFHLTLVVLSIWSGSAEGVDKSLFSTFALVSNMPTAVRAESLKY